MIRDGESLRSVYRVSEHYLLSPSASVHAVNPPPREPASVSSILPPPQIENGGTVYNNKQAVGTEITYFLGEPRGRKCRILANGSRRTPYARTPTDDKTPPKSQPGGRIVCAWPLRARTWRPPERVPARLQGHNGLAIQRPPACAARAAPIIAGVACRAQVLAGSMPDQCGNAKMVASDAYRQWIYEPLL